jgi:hypothetical protein
MITGFRMHLRALKLFFDVQPDLLDFWQGCKWLLGGCISRRRDIMDLGGLKNRRYSWFPDTWRGKPCISGG